MFYYLSKIFDFLIMPYNVMLIGLIVVFFKVRRKRTRGMIAVIFLGLYLQSNAYVVGKLYKAWEYPPRDIENINKHYQVGIVLSGGLLSSCTPNTGGYFDLEKGSDRLLAGYFLYKRGICRKLLLTGTDSDYLLGQNRGEVQLAKALLMEWGVPGEDILLETEARNTRENSIYTARLLRELPGAGDYLLITSAYHMRRAKGCFDKAGLQTDTFPADFERDPECLPVKRRLFPEPTASAGFQRLWHEWVGMAVYRLAGYC